MGASLLGDLFGIWHLAFGILRSLHGGPLAFSPIGKPFSIWHSLDKLAIRRGFQPDSATLGQIWHLLGPIWHSQGGYLASPSPIRTFCPVFRPKTPNSGLQRVGKGHFRVLIRTFCPVLERERGRQHLQHHLIHALSSLLSRCPCTSAAAGAFAV